MNPSEIIEAETEMHFFKMSSSVFVEILKGIVEKETAFYFNESEEMKPVKESFDKAVKATFDGFKESAKNFFSVPKTIKLQPNLSIPDDEDPNMIEEEVKDLEENYKQQLLYQNMLEHELKVLEKLEPVKERVREMIQTYEENEAAMLEMNRLERDFNEILDGFKEKF